MPAVGAAHRGPAGRQKHRQVAVCLGIMHAVRELCGAVRLTSHTMGGQMDEAELKRTLSAIATEIHASAAGEKSYLL